MRNWKIQSENQTIAKYVDCYWLLEKKHDDHSSEFPILNPDPAGHLILSGQQQPYRYELDTEHFSGYGGHLILPHCKSLGMDHSKPFLILGIKFRVGALYSLKLAESQSLLDQVIDTKNPVNLDGLLQQSKLSGLLDQPKMCRDKLDKHLIELLMESHEDSHSALVRDVLALSQDVALSKIGTELGCSQRTIERSFLRVNGFTLKQYQSMERLEAMLEYVHKLSEKEIDWADVAFQFEFSDQPHLVRFVKQSIGKTPGKYARQRGLAIDAYGNFEK